MEAHKHTFIKDVIGKSDAMYTIPVYQRNYSWDVSHTTHLLNDIESILESGASKRHFLGSIVVMLEESMAYSVQRFTLIDGQQRVTTFMLLLIAITEVYPERREQIWNEYLHNKYGTTAEDREKLSLLNHDGEEFRLILNGKTDRIGSNSRMMRNYLTCRRYVERWKQRYTADAVKNALHMLEVVSIALIAGKDDPQEIFESINSTGLPLSKGDLIRNYLLMGERDQKRLYEECWVPLEQVLGTIEGKCVPDQFFYVLLQAQSAEVINKERLYQHFVAYYQKTVHTTKEEFLRELHQAAKIYASFFVNNPHYSPGIQQQLQKLRMLDQATVYPFLYLVFKDYHRQIITEATLEGVLRLLIVYLMRRIVCGVPSNSLRSLFSGLYGRVFREKGNYARYGDAINKFLFTLTSRDKYPTESEFRERLEMVDLYHHPSLCRLILAELENGGSKEQVRMDNMTIEHIMPQRLNAEWAHIPMEDHGMYLHTLGNLTLTAMNAELSNHSFAKKKEILAASKVRILNPDVTDKAEWGIADIQRRGSRLARLVCERFRVQPVYDPSIVFEAANTITLATPELATGTKILSYIYCGEEHACLNYYILARELIFRLDREHPEMLHEMVRRHRDKSVKGYKIHYQYGNEGLWNPMALRDNVYADIHGSSATVLRKIRYLFDQYGIDPAQLEIRVKQKS